MPLPAVEEETPELVLENVAEKPDSSDKVAAPVLIEDAAFDDIEFEKTVKKVIEPIVDDLDPPSWEDI